VVDRLEFPPVTLRQYALLADGERGAVVGPRGDIVFLCAPRWHDDAVFSSLLGGPGSYSVTPRDAHQTWGGHYEDGSLIWHSRWATTREITECREALALPADPRRLLLLRRVQAVQGPARVRVQLECRAGFGARAMTVGRAGDGSWVGRTGDLRFRWSGLPHHGRLHEGRLGAELDVPEGEHHDLLLEISRAPLPHALPDPDDAWARTEASWRGARPDLGGSAAPGESVHSWAVLRGLTSGLSEGSGGMVAAATTSLPERAERGRNYDYRYAWIRDQCYAGMAAAAVGAEDLVDAAVRFVCDRVLDDGARLKPVYTVTGDPVPGERSIGLPGYPGSPVHAGNRARSQFQLDTFGEALLLLSTADRAGRLDAAGWRAIGVLAAAVADKLDVPEAGIWELDNRRWAHSRLMCVAGLRAAATGQAAAASAKSRGLASQWQSLAERVLADVDRDCLHPSGRWQRSPDDESVDAALLLPGIRGAVPASDERNLRTVAAVREDLSDDGYVYRFRHSRHHPLHQSEGAFVLCGFHMALAQLGLGNPLEATRWFERNRGALGPPGLFAEEFDVVQRQLRGNLPQAFVHAAALETAHRLGDAGISSAGFEAANR
jgi:hypothetical protein